MSIVLRFVIAILATWRLTHLLSKEDGPWNIIVRIRRRLGQRFWGKLMDCFKCLSVWVAVPFAFFVGGSIIEIIVSWLAISGGAILLEEHIREPFTFEVGEENEMLRSTTDGDAENYREDDIQRTNDSH
jgi:hypothetical protein